MEFFFSNHSEKDWMDWVVSCEQAMVMIAKKIKERKKYHLIISDIFLAGSGTGIDLMKSLAVKKSGAKTVIVSSAARDEVLKQYGRLLAETQFLHKPLDLNTHAARLLQMGRAVESKQGQNKQGGVKLRFLHVYRPPIQRLFIKV